MDELFIHSFVLRADAWRTDPAQLVRWPASGPVRGAPVGSGVANGKIDGVRDAIR